MADELSGAVRRALADAVRGVVGGRATVTRGTGTYVRTDADGTGWVLMAGADEPTPVNGRALIDAEPGDSVQWELDGTALSVTGNATTPAVGTRQVTREVAPVAERTEVAIEDAAQALEDAANAAGTATKYITDITDSGIWVTPEDAKPEDGAAVSTTSGWHIADALELFRAGASVFKVWVESNMTKLRIGDESGKHLLMDGDGISLKSAAALMARIKTVTNMTTITGRLTFDSGDRALVEGGYNQTNRSAEVEIVASHGESGDTSPYGHDAYVSLVSMYDEIRQRYESSVELAADTIGFSDAENATTTVGMQQAMSHIIGGIELYAGSYSASASSSITLSESAANFSRLLVEYEDSTGRKGSVWVDSPDGSTFSMQTVGGNSSAGMVTRFKTAVASGTTIDTQKDSYNRYTYGKVTVSPSGTVTYANAQEIGITKVVGFR